MSRRGGERVVEALCELYPNADIFTLVAEEEFMSPALRQHRLTTSFLQKIPGRRRWHRHALPLYPLALEQFDLRDYDVVISSESGPAKGVLTRSRTCHICYCHTPMRYLWDLYHEYRSGSGMGILRRSAFQLATHYARLWDQASASRVDHFVANSYNVAARIRKFYRRESDVIYPPIVVEQTAISNTIGDHYLVVGQLVSYKRVDLAIGACNKLGRHLRVIGVGEEYGRLRRIAGPTIEFLGALSDEQVRQEYAQCRALLFPGEEDFGMVPVEAQAHGKPVIAFDAGGAADTVIGANRGICVTPEVASGLFFREQTVHSLSEAILQFELIEPCFSPRFIREHAKNFDKSHFLQNMSQFVSDRLDEASKRNKVERNHRTLVAVS